MYILKLLLNFVTAGIEALVISATCQLSHILNCETLQKLQMVIQNKTCGMLTSGAVYLRDNACLHTAPRAQALLLGHFNWQLSDHHPYSPDLALSHYPPFAYLNNRL
jgi:hypothetical protein